MGNPKRAAGVKRRIWPTVICFFLLSPNPDLCTLIREELKRWPPILSIGLRVPFILFLVFLWFFLAFDNPRLLFFCSHFHLFIPPIYFTLDLSDRGPIPGRSQVRCIKSYVTTLRSPYGTPSPVACRVFSPASQPPTLQSTQSYQIIQPRNESPFLCVTTYGPYRRAASTSLPVDAPTATLGPR